MCNQIIIIKNLLRCALRMCISKQNFYEKKKKYFIILITFSIFNKNLTKMLLQYEFLNKQIINHGKVLYHVIFHNFLTQL